MKWKICLTEGLKEKGKGEDYAKNTVGKKVGCYKSDSQKNCSGDGT